MYSGVEPLNRIATSRTGSSTRSVSEEPAALSGTTGFGAGVGAGAVGGGAAAGNGSGFAGKSGAGGCWSDDPAAHPEVTTNKRAASRYTAARRCRRDENDLGFHIGSYVEIGLRTGPGKGFSKNAGYWHLRAALSVACPTANGPLRPHPRQSGPVPSREPGTSSKAAIVPCQRADPGGRGRAYPPVAAVPEQSPRWLPRARAGMGVVSRLQVRGSNPLRRTSCLLDSSDFPPQPAILFLSSLQTRAHPKALASRSSARRSVSGTECV